MWLNLKNKVHRFAWGWFHKNKHMVPNFEKILVPEKLGLSRNWQNYLYEKYSTYNFMKLEYQRGMQKVHDCVS